LFKLFAAVGFLWVLLGVFVAVRDWGNPEKFEWAVTMALIGAINVGIGWYLQQRLNRLPGRRRR